jgi:hypothetical protein
MSQGPNAASLAVKAGRKVLPAIVVTATGMTSETESQQSLTRKMHGSASSSTSGWKAGMCAPWKGGWLTRQEHCLTIK